MSRGGEDEAHPEIGEDRAGVGERRAGLVEPALDRVEAATRDGEARLEPSIAVRRREQLTDAAHAFLGRRGPVAIADPEPGERVELVAAAPAPAGVRGSALEVRSRVLDSALDPARAGERPVGTDEAGVIALLAIQRDEAPRLAAQLRGPGLRIGLEPE